MNKVGATRSSEVDDHKKRLLNWCAYQIVLVKGVDGEKEICLAEDKTDYIFGFMSRNCSEYRDRFYDLYVPDDRLSWFEDGERFFKWLSKKIGDRECNDRSISTFEKIERNKMVGGATLSNPLSLSFRDRSIMIFDGIEEESYGKEGWLLSLKHEWSDRKRASKMFDWVGGGENEMDKIRLTARLLSEVGGGRGWFRQVPENFEEFLLEFDRSDLSVDILKLASEKAKARWRQQLYRGNDKERKQVNVLLDVDTVQKLKELSRKFGLSDAKVIKMLIVCESLNGKYISESWAKMCRNDNE